MVGKICADVRPFASVKVAAVDGRMLGKTYGMDEGSSRGRKVGEEWNYSLRTDAKIKRVSAVE